MSYDDQSVRTAVGSLEGLKLRGQGQGLGLAGRQNGRWLLRGIETVTVAFPSASVVAVVRTAVGSLEGLKQFASRRGICCR